MGERAGRVWGSYRGLLLVGAMGVPIGVVVGALDAVFGRTLLAIGSVRDAWPYLLVPLLPAAGALSAWLYMRAGRGVVRGMGLVFDVGHGREDSIPLRLVPLVMASTWLTHLCGGSAGREGVAVQIGATVSHWAGRRVPLGNPGNTFLVVGMAAGFAGLFRTPFAATFFALEVLVAGRLEYHALVPALVASLAASATSGALGLERFSVALGSPVAMDLPVVLRLAAAGVVFGIVGGGFAWVLGRAKLVLGGRIEHPVARIAAVAVPLSAALLLCWQGRYCGLGTNLISAAFSSDGSGILAWDWALKLVFTVVTLSAGFQGGEVTPLFSIGASLGAALAGPLGLDGALAAALGYAAVFGGATNTLLAPILIGAEVFGFEHLPAFAIACVAAYAFNMDKSIYSLQRRGGRGA